MINLRLLRKNVYLLAGMLLVPTLLPAAVSVKVEECPTRPATAESYSWNFRGEASQLLHNIQFQSMQVRNSVDSLRQLARQPDLVSWQAYANRLTRVRNKVNVMANEMCRLDSIERMTSPWQQKAINRIRPAVTELADSTAKALSYTDQESMANYASPVYTNDISDIYTVANRIDRTTNDYIELAKARQGLKQLGHAANTSVG